jgi:uncharacterized membrane protein
MLCQLRDWSSDVCSSDLAAARWLSQNADNELKVYVDDHSVKFLTFYEFPGRMEELPIDTNKFEPDSYIYFTAWNLDKKEITFAIAPGLRRHVSFDDIPGLITAIDSKDRIYTNGGAQILAPKYNLASCTGL